MSTSYVLANVGKNMAARVVGHRGKGARYGMDGDLHRVTDTLERFAPGLAPARAQKSQSTILELGYGRTMHLCAAFLLAGAARAVAVETVDRALPDAAEGRNFRALPQTLKEHAPAFLSAMAADGDLEERYNELGPQTWPIDRRQTVAGRLPVADNSVDLVYSKSVLEHVDGRAVEGLLSEIRRVLRPGGLTIHLIDLRDHMWIDGDWKVTGDWLDALRYSDRTFRAMFSHRSTSINRRRASEWRQQFDRAGLALQTWDVERFALADGFDQSRLQPRWRELPSEEISVAWVLVAATKPT